MFRGPQATQNRLDAKREILSQLISTEVSLQGAQSLGIARVGTEDPKVADRLKSIQAEYGGKQGFAAQLKRERLSVDDVKKDIANTETINAVAKKVAVDIKPTAQEVEQFYNLNKSQFDAQIKVSQILICGKFDAAARSCNAGPEDQARAADVARRARAGEDFGALARQFSVDPSTRDAGGDLGFISRGDVVPEFEAAAFALASPGDVSDPVRSQFGYHVIKLTAIGRPFEDARAGIETTLTTQKTNRAYQDWLVEALKKANVKVNPALGRFDKISQTVVAVASGTRRAGSSPAPESPAPSASP